MPWPTETWPHRQDYSPFRLPASFLPLPETFSLPFPSYACLMSLPFLPVEDGGGQEGVVEGVAAPPLHLWVMMMSDAIV